jgi:hypothetical protein
MEYTEYQVNRFHNFMTQENNEQPECYNNGTAVEQAQTGINAKFFSQSGLRRQEFEAPYDPEPNIANEQGFYRGFHPSNDSQVNIRKEYEKILVNSNFATCMDDSFYKQKNQIERDSLFDLRYDGFEYPVPTTQEGGVYFVKPLVEQARENMMKAEREYMLKTEHELREHSLNSIMYRSPDNFLALQQYLRRYYNKALE